MSTFFERNKKKSLLALLLLFLKWRKGAAPMLLMVVLVMFVFVAPSNLIGISVDFIGRMPGGARVAAAITRVAVRLGLKDEDKRSFHDLMAAFRLARERSSVPLGAVYYGGKGGPPPSSIAMVKGRMSDYESRADVEGRLKGGRTVSGIVNPDEDQGSADGVEMSEEELSGAGGFVESAYAQGAGYNPIRGGAFAGQAGAAGQSGSAGRSQSAAFIEGRGAYNVVGPSGETDRFQQALFHTESPDARWGKKITGEGGKLSGKEVRARSARASAANANAVKQHAGNKKALLHLGDAYARTKIARDPFCTGEGGCPPEFASNSSGAVYDGNRVGATNSQIVTAAGLASPAIVDGVATPIPPNDADLAGMMGEASQMEKDAKECEAARENHRGAISAKMNRIQELSNEMNAMDCGGGGCSKSKAKKCKAKGNAMKAACRDLDSEMRAEWNECPLNKDTPYTPQECN